MNIFIVKTLLNSAFTNDLKRKDFFSKNVHSCRLSLFNQNITKESKNCKKGVYLQIFFFSAANCLRVLNLAPAFC